MTTASRLGTVRSVPSGADGGAGAKPVTGVTPVGDIKRGNRHHVGVRANASAGSSAAANSSFLLGSSDRVSGAASLVDALAELADEASPPVPRSAHAEMAASTATIVTAIVSARRRRRIETIMNRTLGAPPETRLRVWESFARS
jgi:hypothetical protein